MTTDTSLWQIKQEHENMLAQEKLLMVKCSLLKKKQLELKAHKLKAQLELQSCLRLQELLRSCGQPMATRDVRSKFQFRVDERSMSPEAITAYREMEKEFVLVDEIPRSWVTHPWRWCATNYGGCCQHCPRDGLEDDMPARERIAGLQLTEKSENSDARAYEN